jgi:hypothetical protein
MPSTTTTNLTADEKREAKNAKAREARAAKKAQAAATEAPVTETTPAPAPAEKVLAPTAIQRRNAEAVMAHAKAHLVEDDRWKTLADAWTVDDIAQVLVGTRFRTTDAAIAHFAMTPDLPAKEA